MNVGCQGVQHKSKSAAADRHFVFERGTLDFGTVTAGTSKTLTRRSSKTGRRLRDGQSATISTQYFLMSAPSFRRHCWLVKQPVSVVFRPNAPGDFHSHGFRCQ